MNNNLRDSKVDLLTTKDINFHQRRIKNAAPSVDRNDYVTRQELDSAVNQPQESGIFKKIGRFFAGIVVKSIAPFQDIATAIQILKADRQTVLINIDTLNENMQIGAITGVSNASSRRYLTIRGKTGAGFLELTQNNADIDATIYGGVQVADFNCTGTEKRLGFIAIATNGTTANNRGGRIVFGVKTDAGSLSTIMQLDNNAIGFFGTTPVAKQTLSAYTTSSRASSFTSTPAALTSAATLADLNTLRASYETLRLAYDDLRTKLQTTTLVG